jgi:hypothetical protein
MSPRYVPDAPMFDPRGMLGGASAIVVAMINNSKDVDFRDDAQVQAVAEAMKVIIPAYVRAAIQGQAELGRDHYAE